MKKTTTLWIIALVTALSLSGCVSREQADSKLAKACAAGAETLLSGATLNVKDFTATASPEGPDFRHITIQTGAEDGGGWLEEQSEYECIFQETFSMFNSGYTASIYQVRVGDEIIGQAGNDIMGDAQQFLRLTDAVRKAMYE